MSFDEILNLAKEKSVDKKTFLSTFLELYKNYNQDLYPPLREKYSVKDFNLNGKYYLFERNDKFNFDYILYIPEEIKYKTLLVEGANGSRYIKSNKDEHEWLGEDDNRYIGITIDQLATSSGLEINDGVAIMVPIIPDYRKRNETDGHEFFPRQYSRNSLIVSDKEDRFYNFDGQIVNMINDAKEKVKTITDILFEDKIAMYGFSTSSKFAYRFTACHPEMVSVVAAGGVGGQNILPLEELNEKKLIYPIGVGDLQTVIGNKFNLTEFKKIKQFYYLGELDENDTVNSLIHHDQKIIDLYNEIFKNKNILERWLEIIDLYEQFTNVYFKTYKNSYHLQPFAAIDDVRNFIYSNLEKTDYIKSNKI